MSASRRSSRLSLTFRRAAERQSLLLRSATGHTHKCALSLESVMKHLELGVVPLTQLADSAPKAAFRLYASTNGVFSAAAICDGALPIGIVYNDANDPVRQRADIAHECAHIILGHKPTNATNDAGARVFPEQLETEASWLGPTLLVPRTGMIAVLQETNSLSEAAAHFNVSLPLARFVYNTRGCSRYVSVTD